MAERLLPSGARQLSLFESDAPTTASQPAAEISDRVAVEDGEEAAPLRDPDVGASARPDAPKHRPHAASLRAAIDEFKQFMAAANRSKHTRDSFTLDLKLLLEHLGDVRLSEISERDLRSFISWVSVQRHNSPTSVRRKVATLKNFFAYLRRELLIPSDPALRLIYPEIYPALPEFLEDRQVAQLLDAADEHVLWKALIALMIDTGLKRDEVVALGRGDIQLSDEAGGYLVVRDTEQAKRLRSRRLEISAQVASLLRDFQREDEDASTREHFFGLSPRGVNFVVEVCGKRGGLIMRGAKLTPQILRETFAVRKMREFVQTEDALRQQGATEDSLQAVIERHDLALLNLLGLHPEPESAKKYRKLVRGWSSVMRLGPDQ